MRASGGLFDLDALNESIALNEHRMAEPGFWQDQQAAQKLIAQNNELKERRDTFTDVQAAVRDLADTIELLELEADPALAAELATNLKTTQAQLEAYRLSQLLSEPYDAKDAILEIHPGPGGQKPRTGAKCCCGCTRGGRTSITLRLK